MTAKELCTTKPDFFLKNTDGQYKLKQKHNYYYQVQGQMHITNRKWFDLIVWNPQGTDKLIVDRIHYNKIGYTTIRSSGRFQCILNCDNFTLGPCCQNLLVHDIPPL